jgi:5-methyltetrahydrofolate--homocysteine methyltransferase
MADMNAIQEAIVACDEAKAKTLVEKALADGTAATEILNAGLISGMDVVGDRMENGDMFIPEVLMAAQAMSSCVEILKPLLGEDGSAKSAKVLIGTVKGDLHDIGKNLVAMMIESSGMTVYNLGVDISPDEFVKHIKEKDASIICLSALLTTTMPMMKETINAIKEAGLRDKVKIMVGGAPVTQSFADSIEADGFAPDAGSAAKLVKALAA